MDFLSQYLSPYALLRSKDCVGDAIFKDEFHVLDSACVSYFSPDREQKTVGGKVDKGDSTATCLQRQSSSKRHDESSTTISKGRRMVFDDYLDSSHEDYFRNVFKAKTLQLEELASVGLTTSNLDFVVENAAYESIDSSPWDEYVQRALQELDNLEKEDEVVECPTPACNMDPSSSSGATGSATPNGDQPDADEVESDDEEYEESDEEEFIEIGRFSRFGALLPPFSRKEDEGRFGDVDSPFEGELQELEDEESEDEDGELQYPTPALTTDSCASPSDAAPATPNDDRSDDDRAWEDSEGNGDDELALDSGTFARYGSLLPPFPHKCSEVSFVTSAADWERRPAPEEAALAREVSNVEPPRRFADGIESGNEASDVDNGDVKSLEHSSDDEEYQPSEEYEETEEASDPGPSRRRVQKRKREAETEEGENDEYDDGELYVPKPKTSRVKNAKKADERDGGLRNKDRNKKFNVDFLLERFRFVSADDADKRWECPFPPSTPSRPSCQTQFGLTALWDHVSNHVAELRRTYGKASVPCPSAQCKWRSPNSRPVEKIGPNDSLVRHVLDQHLGARKKRCACGSNIVRPHKDQIIRHLEAPSHAHKIQKMKREGSVAADYPTFDRSRILAEQAEWTANRPQAAAEGQAGPSRVSKRGRLA